MPWGDKENVILYLLFSDSRFSSAARSGIYSYIPLYIAARVVTRGSMPLQYWKIDHEVFVMNCCRRNQTVCSDLVGLDKNFSMTNCT